MGVTNHKHKHQVIDSDAHFTIDAVTRNIINDNLEKNVIIQGDHNSERFTFAIPRYIDGHDMMLCNHVQVAYIDTQTSGRDKKYSTGVYLVNDLSVHPTKKDYVQCSWLISHNATRYEGALNFMLILSCMEGELVTYRWKTNVFEGIHVAVSLDSNLVFEDEYVDIIEQWENSVMEHFTEYVEAGMTYRAALVKEELSEDLSAEFAELSTDLHSQVQKDTDAMSEHLQANIDTFDEILKTEIMKMDTALEGFDDILETEITKMDGNIDVLKARMDTFTALGEGSTTGDAELADIRVGADGTEYPNAGDAVRKQISHYSETYDRKFSEIASTSINMFDRSRPELGYYDVNGLLREITGYFHTHPIRVEEGKTYKWLSYLTYGTNRNLVIKLNADNTITQLAAPDVAEDDTITWTATETCWISVNIASTYSNTMMFTLEEDYPGMFVPYSVFRNPDFNLNVVVSEKEASFCTHIKTENIFNKETAVHGIYHNLHTGELLQTTYMSSAYIPIEEPGVYSCLCFPSFFGLQNAHKIAILDADKNYLKFIEGTLPYELEEIVESLTLKFEITQGDIFEGARYIVYTIMDAYVDTAMMVKSDVYPDEYIEYVDYWSMPSIKIDHENVLGLSEVIKESVEPVAGRVSEIEKIKSNNHLYNKTIVFDGDSICQATSETTATTDRGWAYRVGDANGMLWRNAAISGGTITAEVYTNGGAARHWVCRNIDTILAEQPDLEYYIFEGGTNDADLLGNTPERIGVIDETDFSGNYDDTTFCGAFESIIYKAMMHKPTLKIGYVVAPKMSRNSKGYGENNIRYKFFTLAMRICKKWGVPYVNLWDESPLNPMILSHYDKELDIEGNKAAGSLYTDGQHLTGTGYDVVSSKISSFVKSL